MKTLDKLLRNVQDEFMIVNHDINVLIKNYGDEIDDLDIVKTHLVNAALNVVDALYDAYKLGINNSADEHDDELKYSYDSRAIDRLKSIVEERIRNQDGEFIDFLRETLDK